MALLPPVVVLGAGSWGTALAITLARKGQQEVRLWGRDVKQMKEMASTRCNQRYLPEIVLPQALQCSSDLPQVLKGVQDILIAVPSSAFVSILEKIQTLIPKGIGIAWATKGLEPHTYQLLHRVVKQRIPTVDGMAVLSGPSFANEVALGLPTAITVAADNESYAQHWGARLHAPHFRVYPNQDMIGVQLCGALKNVLAIATGMIDGMQLGANARAALVTRGLAEMTRLGIAMGARAETFTGLAGLGDLVLTCTTDQSRNRRFGVAVGEGLSAEQALQRIDQVVEGLDNVEQVHRLATEHQVDLPICQQVYNVLHQAKALPQAVEDMLARAPKKGEFF